MKEHYDFLRMEGTDASEAPNHPPVYLDSDIAAFMQALADEKQTDLDSLVNDWLRQAICLIRTVR